MDADPATPPEQPATGLTHVNLSAEQVKTLSLRGGVIACLIAVLQMGVAPATAEVTGEVTRLAGPERVATAKVISQQRWVDGDASVVVLARSDVAADAVTSSPLAAGSGPVLLSRVDELPADTASEIQRVLRPDGVVLLVGGTAALSATVEEQVQALGVMTRRIAGPNRFGTAADCRGAGGPECAPTRRPSVLAG